MSVSRPCSDSQVTSSWLIFSDGLSVPLEMSCTTMVRSIGSLCLVWSFGGCGTSASRPLGVSGVITMKMMSSTSSTSISGVTLMSAEGPLPLPMLIAIAGTFRQPARGGLEFLPLFPAARRRCPRRRRERSLFALLGEQPKLVHARGAHVVHHLHHRPVLGARVGADEHPLVHSVGDAVFDLG